MANGRQLIGPDGQPFPAYLVKGDDATITADAVHRLVEELVGDTDASLAVEELSGENLEVTSIVDAVQTPPFFGDRRVVIVRDAGRFLASEVAPLVAYLADPLPTTSLLLVAGGGQMPRSLVDAVRKVGHVVDASVPSGKGRAAWLASQLKAAPVRLDGRATQMLADHLGEDVGRLGSLLQTLVAAFGEGARLGQEEIAAYLGQAGSVAPWELTDAIDRGDTEAALGALHRLMGSGRHPLVILATLHTHFSRMLRLDGSDIADQTEAASVLGLTGSTFPAKKALLQARHLGHASIVRAISLLADADVALKGAIDWAPNLVMEVLIARLCYLGPARARRSS